MKSLCIGYPWGNKSPEYWLNAYQCSFWVFRVNEPSMTFSRTLLIDKNKFSEIFYLSKLPGANLLTDCQSRPGIEKAKWGHLPILMGFNIHRVTYLQTSRFFIVKAISCLSNFQAFLEQLEQNCSCKKLYLELNMLNTSQPASVPAYVCVRESLPFIQPDPSIHPSKRPLWHLYRSVRSFKNQVWKWQTG